MTTQLRKPKQALNKAYLKLKPTRDEIDTFKKNLIDLIDKIDIKESEEHAKNLVRDFLLDTYYKGLYEINTKNRNDLVIHSEKTSGSPVSVIIEAKRPSEKYDFPTANNLNVKAVQELVLYYLRERVDCSNSDIRHLVATNGYEWFIFDSSDFHKFFYSNSALLKEYNKWNSGQKDSSSTQMFYNDIAKKYINEIKADIPFTYFNIHDYNKFLRNEDKEDDKNLIPLFKLLSPSHLLKLSFSNDSNSLDKNFYFELLHIIGLEEVKDGSKKIIQRKRDPDEGSLLENTINILKSEDRLHKVNNPNSFGKDKEDQYFGIALELCITWINRILFLKLLEAQLLKYFKGDKEYKFLTFDNISNFDALNKLFFQVLAVKPEDRGASVKSKFAKIPYLNSSLFEMSGLEDDLIRISNLEDDPVIPIISKTVLKHTDGKKKSGKISSLQYLFDFLDSYDFSSEGSEDIQEERKTLINASVLGLIFEKINGYKDGSFFTPGFITMYMSRETIRRAVIQKFNDTYKVNIKDFGELKNFVGLPYKKDEIKKYNEVINSLKICDPAVGSGHFLVSVLNEIIAVKSELNLLSDSEGNRLIGYSAFVENDELTLVNTMSGDLFEYKPGNHESQRIQEALFHEKQTIIENCLFGVDINHNSVKICRLRLWIELLKNAYYTKESNHKELETLPNIDINIKCGNSLVSRFSLDADLSSALRKSKWTITSYRLAVQSYQNAKTKDEKRELEKLLNEIKSNFRTEISDNDPKHKRLERLEGELYEKYTSNKLLSVSLTDKEKAKEEKDKLKLQADIEKLKSEIKEIKESAIYRNAFEWRFEFPEVLDEKGSFIGFDVVIGNPPYFQIQKLDVNINSVKGNYKTYEQMGDIYVLFYERGYNILSKKGILNFITSNKWLRANYGNSLRKFLINYTNCLVLIDFNYYQVFEEASVDTNILSFLKGKSDKIKSAVSIREGFSVNEINDYVSLNSKEVSGLTENYWNVSTDDKTGKLNSKLNSLGIKLKNWNINFNRGVLTGFNDAFIIDKKTKEFLISEDKNNIELIMPYLRGRDIKRYSFNHEDLWLIFTKHGTEISKYPSILKYLSNYKEQLTPKENKEDRIGRKPGQYKWYEIQDTVAYYEEFLKEKIIYAETMRIHKTDVMNFPRFGYDNNKYFCDKTTFIITGQNLKYLLGIMNSKLGAYLVKEYVTKLDTGGYMMQKVFIEEIPIIKPAENEKISQAVTKIIDLNKRNQTKEISEIEKEIDKLVYQLYGLTDEEIEIVERG